MALTLQQKRAKANAFFNRLYGLLLSYYQEEGFHTIPITLINIPRFEEIDVYFRVTGTANNANLDMLVEHDGTQYARRDTVVNGTRNVGTWGVVNVTLPTDLPSAPPYAVQVKENVCISF